MAEVTFLVSDLGYTGAAKQLSLLAPGLVRAGWTVQVFTGCRDGPFATPLRAAGVRVETTRGRQWLTVRRLSGTVHVIGLKALGRLWLATLGARRPRVVLSLTGHERLTRFDRSPLRLAARVLVPHLSAADALVRQGVPPSLVTVVPTAVADAPPATDRDSLAESLGVPADAPWLLSAGRMDTRRPMLGSIWAFEFLRYIEEDVRLLLVGDGPARDRIEAAARGLAPDGSRVHFLGARPDVPALIGLADLVLVPQPAGGTNVALEAMAAGRAVIAADTPDLAAVIEDGWTGLLARPNYPPGIAVAIRKLLADPARRRAVGTAAREQARRHHSVDTLVRAMESVYRE
jgi:glycosyltransferase involved in cell wall biosynthesis